MVARSPQQDMQEVESAVAVLPVEGVPGKPITVIGTRAIREQFDEKCLIQAVNSRKAPGVTDITAALRGGARVVKEGRADYLLPTVVHCASPDAAVAKKEYMFPFVTVVECAEDRMIEAIGPTLVCTAITGKPELRRRLLDAVNIDRLNFGPVPTIQLNWLQPHEGNIVEFLFRARAFQTA